MEHTLDKDVSKENLIFITIATILVVALIFMVVIFAGVFRSDMYKLANQKEVTTRNSLK